ncbi:MAG: hypothetical protein JW715_10230 [Sedimentisphaerales bacterium]|nr:hypothetical protein [Sedimentisphaerales bacterium]
MSGLFIALVRLNLGMPGHKAFFWMTPVLISRLHGRCRIGTTLGGLFAAITTYSMGAHLAGGVIGMPIIVAAAIILDWTVNFIEKNNFSGFKMILLLGIAGAAANLVCLSKRMILPAGLSPHFILGVSGTWFRICSYAFFGLLSGVVAAISVIHKQDNYKSFRSK